MFESHFGLRDAPFRLSPDPGFYFGSRGHSQALSCLVFGVHQREGFIVLTGESGVGKSTLVHTLLQGLPAHELVAAQVVNTQLDETGLLAAICHAYGVPMPGRTRAGLFATLEAFFTAVAAGGRRALLVVDEAHNLGPREIEQLRLLSNLQLGPHALVQGLLVGQPELRERLGAAALASFRQRVIASGHLGPLSRVETMSYVHHRMEVAGWRGAPVFGEATIEQVHDLTGGNPRRINLLCTRLLLSAFVERRLQVDAAKVQAMAAEVDGRPVTLAVAPAHQRRKWPPA